MTINELTYFTIDFVDNYNADLRKKVIDFPAPAIPDFGQQQAIQAGNETGEYLAPLED
jgi:hypothetical protein